MKSKRQKRVKIISYILLIAISVTMLFPFFWMIRSAFMTNREITTVPIQWIPSQFNFDNFVEAFTRDSFGRYFLNSGIIVIVNMVGGVLSSSFIAFQTEIQRKKHLVCTAFIYHDDSLYGIDDSAVFDLAVCGRV